MYAYIVFNKLYKSENIFQHYHEKIKGKCSTGLDKISPSKFEETINENVDIICRKVHSGKYTFTKYKKMLISKGEKKHPRVICMPTIRDKVVLSILNKCISTTYDASAISLLPHVIVNSLCKDIEENKYNSFIKIDIKTFYASINHEILVQKIRKKIRKSELTNLITNAIRTPAIDIPVKTRTKSDMARTVGIPEGISISNILANIYLLDIDNKYSNDSHFSYYRYVDDILILCNDDRLNKIKNNIITDLQKIKLETNEKEDSGTLCQGFEYLGYKLNSSTVTVRESTVLKFESSLESTFSSYKHAKNPSVNLLLWKLNLKITGCITEDKKYGWLFYFSQINDMALLTRLDCLIKKLIKRFDLPIERQSYKRLKRSYYEIKHRLHSSTYIPNFDTYSIDDIKNILENIYGEDLSSLNDEEIKIFFKKIMSKETKELERDVQFFS